MPAHGLCTDRAPDAVRPTCCMAACKHPGESSTLRWEMSSVCRPYVRMAVHRCAPDAGGSQAPDPGELGDAIRVGMPFGCAPDAVRPTCLQGNSTHALPVPLAKGGGT